MAVTAALFLSGCGAASSAAPAAAPASTTARSAEDLQAALMGSLPQTKYGPFRFSVTGGDDALSGVIDAPQKTTSFDVVNHYAGYSMAMSIIVRDLHAWVKIKYTGTARSVPATWMTIDFQQTRKTGGDEVFNYGTETDPGFATDILEYGTGLHEAAPGHLTGVTDLGSTYGGHVLTADHLHDLGEKAKAVPFTAVLDGQGRLTVLTLALPAGSRFPASTYRVAYYGYDSTPAPAPPADGTPAPAWVYSLFTGAQFAGPLIRGK